MNLDHIDPNTLTPEQVQAWFTMLGHDVGYVFRSQTSLVAAWKRGDPVGLCRNWGCVPRSATMAHGLTHGLLSPTSGFCEGG